MKDRRCYNHAVCSQQKENLIHSLHKYSGEGLLTQEVSIGLKTGYSNQVLWHISQRPICQNANNPCSIHRTKIQANTLIEFYNHINRISLYRECARCGTLTS